MVGEAAYDWQIVSDRLSWSPHAAAVLGIADRVLVMGEGKLRGNFVNEGLTQEKVLAAAIGQPTTDDGLRLSLHKNAGA